MRFLVMLLVLASCGNGGVDSSRTWAVTQEEEFIDLINEFDSIYSTSVLGGITIRFGDTATEEKPKAVGWCVYAKHRYIVISPKYWRDATHNQKESLLFHELGHCIFNRRHNEDTIYDEDFGWVAASIMYPSVIGGSAAYDKLRNEYLQELPDQPELTLYEENFRIE